MPARLNLRSRVTHVDCKNASVTLENGEVFSGDVVVGADGVHVKGSIIYVRDEEADIAQSRTRGNVDGGNKEPFESGKSAFRFLIPKQRLYDDPATRKYVERKGILIMWIGDDRRLVMYPCANNTLMNFVAIHPSNETDAAGDGENSPCICWCAVR